MKKYCFLILAHIVCVLVSLHAENIDVDKARLVATSFLQQQSGLSLRSSSLALHQVNIEQSLLRTESIDPNLFVFNINDDEGFIIVSGDDRALPVLAFSDEGKIDIDEISPATLYWLSRYNRQMEEAAQQNAPRSQQIIQKWKALEQGSVTPELRVTSHLPTPNWGQGYPFHLLCPQINDQYTYTGCTATAMAMIMYYHRWPEQATGSHSYYWDKQTLYTNFPDPYNWKTMPSEREDITTEAQQKQIARLMYDCAVSVNSSFGLLATGAAYSTPAAAFPQFFKYETDIHWRSRIGYTTQQWFEIARTDIDNGFPLILCGEGSHGGHVFVCDGYMNSDYFHINWGWYGRSNGYFAVDALEVDGDNYSTNEFMISSIQPRRTPYAIRLNDLRIANVMGYKGLYINVEDAPLKDDFKIEVASVVNGTMDSFDGYVAILLMEENDQLKEVVSQGYLSIPIGVYYRNISFACHINGTIDSTDRFRFASKRSGDAHWKIVEGAEDITSWLPVKNNELTYYSITWKRKAGIRISPFNLCYYDKAIKGMDYLFSLDPPERIGTVLCNNQVITPDSEGVYLVENVQSDLTIEILDPEYETEVSSIVLDKKEHTMAVGETLHLQASIEPINATNKSVTWSTDKKKVATVTNGWVTAHAPGVAIITVTTQQGELSAQCEVTVAEAVDVADVDGKEDILIWADQQSLFIESDRFEQIRLYDRSGKLLTTVAKQSRLLEIPLLGVSDILLVVGSDGWSRKISVR